MTGENKRVYELAKEYDMSNKDFIEYLDKKLDIKVKSHSSNLTPAQIDKIKDSFKKGPNKEPDKKPKAFIIKKKNQKRTLKKEKTRNQKNSNKTARKNSTKNRRKKRRNTITKCSSNKIVIRIQ